MTAVRQLTELGIASFTEYLKRLNNGEKVDPPMHLLIEPESSEALLATVEIEPIRLETKLHAAKYLKGMLLGLDKSEVDNNVGLWSWLSLHYFDQVCPPAANRNRSPGEVARHVLSRHAQKYYRHLLAGPYRLLAHHGETARVFLYNPLPQHGDFSEQLASRMQIISNRALIAAVDRLYFDPTPNTTGKPKRGALTRSRPGNLRRLVAVIQQFDLTYDMYAMSTEEILELLPDEFSRWKE